MKRMKVDLACNGVNYVSHFTKIRHTIQIYLKGQILLSGHTHTHTYTHNLIFLRTVKKKLYEVKNFPSAVRTPPSRQ
jgi:hypothetical protein